MKLLNLVRAAVGYFGAIAGLLLSVASVLVFAMFVITVGAPFIASLAIAAILFLVFLVGIFTMSYGLGIAQPVKPPLVIGVDQAEPGKDQSVNVVLEKVGEGWTEAAQPPDTIKSNGFEWIQLKQGEPRVNVEKYLR